MRDLILRKQELLFAPGLAIPVAVRDMELARRAFETAMDDLSSNTLRAYQRVWKEYGEWCAAQDVQLLPIRPETLIVFCQELADGGRARATIRQSIFALSKIDHYARRTPTDLSPAALHDHAIVKAWWKGYKKEQPARKRPAPVISPEQFRDLIRSIYRPPRKGPCGPANALYQMRDRAILLIGYFAAARREEICSFRVGDFLETPRGLEVLFRRSKRDQEGKGEERTLLPQGETLLCPVDAWRVWKIALESAGKDNPEAPAFPVITGHTIGSVHLHVEALYAILLRRSEVINVKLRPHSLRAMFATHAILAGHDPQEVAYHGRWKALQSVELYVRRGKYWTKNPTAGLALLTSKKGEIDDAG